MKKAYVLPFCFGMLATMLAALITCIIIYAITGCIQQKTVTDQGHTRPQQIAPYLYEISYNDYQFDENQTTLDTMEAFGCSSARNGNFYSRNFDFIFDDTPEFVVRMNAKEGRHASIGVALHRGLREANMQAGEYKEQLKLIPNFTLDGINDAGVIISDNVVSQKDVKPLTGTNPSGEKLHAGFVPRMVLNEADSADEAIELIKSRNIYGEAVSGMYLHYMIADANKTYVVELIDNKVVVEEKTGDQQIMTNFYVNMPEISENAAGVERYNILKENYASMNSMEGISTAFEKVRFSNAYRYSTEPLWLSEVMPKSIANTTDLITIAEMTNRFDNLRADYWNAITNDTRNPANPAFWHTTHNSTYDISKKLLRLTVQEDYAHHYDFTL